MRTALVDISRSWPSTETDIIDHTRTFATQRFGEPVDVVVLGFDHHSAAIGELGERTTFRSLGATLPEEAVVAAVAEVLGTLEGEVTVFSFHPQVIAKHGELAAMADRFEAQSLTGLLPKAKAAGGWPEGFVPLGDAIRMLVRGLLKNGRTSPANAEPKTSLRHLLELEDQRFAKGSSPAAQTPRLITILLDEAVARGQVRCVGVNPQVSVWVPQQAVQPGAAAASAGDESEPGETRSQRFIRCLKDGGFGPFSDLRLKVYESVEFVLKENAGGLNESELIKRAVDRVRVDGPGEFLRRDRVIPRDQFPWRKLREFLSKLLRRQAVLIGPDGAAFTPSFVTVSRPVHGLEQDWRLRLEGELLVELVRHCDDIGYGDLDDLVGALLADRSSENTRWVEGVIGYLMDAGRLEQDGETGFLCLTRAKAAVTAV